MSNIHLSNLIKELLENDDFSLIPFNPNPNKDIKFLFDFFSNLNSNIIMTELSNHLNDINIIRALRMITHYKGDLDYFNNKISFEHYTILKPFLNKKSLDRFMVEFYEFYGSRILSDKISVVDDNLLDYIFENNLDLFIDISLKLGLKNCKKVFEKDKLKVFKWINNHPDKYNELKFLNEPQFIFDNMNGRLDINDDSLKYFFEICPADLDVFKELKKSLSIETIWNHTKHKLSVEFIMEIAETVDDIIFILTLPIIPISSIESILNKLKTKFPLLYENFNSLLLMKKEFP